MGRLASSSSSSSSTWQNGSKAQSQNSTVLSWKSPSYGSPSHFLPFINKFTMYFLFPIQFFSSPIASDGCPWLLLASWNFWHLRCFMSGWCPSSTMSDTFKQQAYHHFTILLPTALNPLNMCWSPWRNIACFEKGRMINYKFVSNLQKEMGWKTLTPWQSHQTCLSKHKCSGAKSRSGGVFFRISQINLWEKKFC